MTLILSFEATRAQAIVEFISPTTSTWVGDSLRRAFSNLFIISAVCSRELTSDLSG